MGHVTNSNRCGMLLHNNVLKWLQGGLNIQTFIHHMYNRVLITIKETECFFFLRVVFCCQHTKMVFEIFMLCIYENKSICLKVYFSFCFLHLKKFCIWFYGVLPIIIDLSVNIKKYQKKKKRFQTMNLGNTHI